MTNTNLFLLFGTSLSLIPSLAFAQCVATQDCATLGYTETSCNGGSGVKCPFGNSWACFKSESEICNDLGFTLSCTGTGYSGGTGKACNGKYNICSCSSGYEWKDGSCQKNAVLNGAQGELYYCNGDVVGVKSSNMDFYIGIKDLGQVAWDDADNQCRSYSFCSNVKGTLPTKEQLLFIYYNKSQVNSLLSANGGEQLTNNYYWSSTYYSPTTSSGFLPPSSGPSYYVVNMSSGSSSYYADNFKFYARPVLAF